MPGLSLLLGAVLEAGLGVLAEAGFGDEARALKERLTKPKEKERHAAFDRAFDQAVQAAGLLDPEQGFDVQAAAEVWGEQLPEHARALRRFFSALENALLGDETWGPVLDRYQELRFRGDVLEALREQNLDVPPRQIVSTVNAQLSGSGAIAQGLGAVAAGEGGVAIGRDVLGDVIHTVIQQLRIEIPAPQPDAQPEDWESHYLRTLIGQCDPLDLTPIDETHPQAGLSGESDIVRVTDVFTTLYLERLAREPDQTIADAILQQHTPASTALDRGSSDHKVERIQAVEAVGAVPRLVILGQPGGGKSTLVNHLSTQLARRRLGESIDDEKLPGWLAGEQPLPVRIILRRFAAWLPEDTVQGEAGHVWNYLEYRLEQWGCKEAFPFLKQTLTEQGGAIFFDGLDEVRELDETGKRSLIKEAIEGFAAPLSKCRVVVTCREYAYKRGDAWRLLEAEFPVVELALFDSGQIKTFTQIWYQTVGPQKGWGADKCQTEADNLYRAIGTWPHLRALAQYPLLLTLMAQVHGRDGYLPQDRADLYERAVNLLLAHWENRIVRDVSGARQIEPGLVMQLGIRTETLRSALERVAFAAHERQEREEGRGERAADIPREELREELAADLGSLDKAEQVITYIQHRAGLLQARDNRTYAFPHRTFQEYLAATYLLKQSAFDTMLRDRVRRDLIWWREVFLLAAGASRSTPRNISDLVDCLLPLAPEDGQISPEKAEQARLGAQAVSETNFVLHVRKEEAREPGRYSATLRRIRKWLMAGLQADAMLSAEERVACGNSLAGVGDPRFRVDAWYLPDKPLLGFVEIPAGSFLMGSDRHQDPDARDNELPQHSRNLQGYYVARYPVTVAQFRAFVEDSGHKPADEDCLRGVENHPVVWIAWYDARAYCDWLTERLRTWEETSEPLARLLREGGWQVRLLTEAEWEKAARGTDGRIFPWGNGPDADRANYGDAGIGGTSAVGCFPGGASPYGVLDMSGNVWEWCATKYQDSYEGYRNDNDPRGNNARVLRGGAFHSSQWYVRCAFRFRLDPDLGGRLRGFRICVAPGF
jgi:formylglycine-generating enzyme required for sulfatase activity